MTEIEQLNLIKRKAENESSQAQNKINELFAQITELNAQIKYFEGERDVAQYLLDYVDTCIKTVENIEGLEES